MKNWKEFLKDGSWFDFILDKLDYSGIKNRVNNLQEENPALNKNQLTDKLISEKRLYGSTIGLLAGLTPPGISLPAALGDIASLMYLQAELILEIATIYELDISQRERRLEILLVLLSASTIEKGTELGIKQLSTYAGKEISSHIIKEFASRLGLKLTENLAKGIVSKSVWVIGGIISAGANYIALTIVGKAAKRFYEKKINEKLKTGIIEAEAITEISSLSAELKTNILENIPEKIAFVRLLIGMAWSDKYLKKSVKLYLLEQIEQHNLTPQEKTALKNETKKPIIIKDEAHLIKDPDLKILLLKELLLLSYLDGHKTPEKELYYEITRQGLAVDLQTAKNIEQEILQLIIFRKKQLKEKRLSSKAQNFFAKIFKLKKKNKQK